MAVDACHILEKMKCNRNNTETIKKLTEKSDKLDKYYHMLAYWMYIKQDGKSIGKILYDLGFRNVAVYGMKELGELVYRELRGSTVKVEFVMDQKPEGIYVDVPIYTPQEQFPDVDAIIVTAVMNYKEIKEILQEKTDGVIISLEDIIYEVR